MIRILGLVFMIGAAVLLIGFHVYTVQAAETKLESFNLADPQFTSEHVNYALDTELRLYDLSTGEEIKNYVIQLPVGEIWEGKGGKGHFLSGSFITNCKNKPIVPIVSGVLLLIGIIGLVKGQTPNPGPQVDA
jgi:hypothetical protein